MELTKTAGNPADKSEKRTDAAEEETNKAKPYVPLENVSKASKDDAGSVDSLNRVVDEGREELVDRREVDITPADKAAFLDAIVSGSRFVSEASLFDGRVKVSFRSRSVEETEAILAYLHRSGVAGKFTTRTDVRDTSLLALLVAQVASLNDVDYDEMRRPLNAVETLGGVTEPAWVEDLEIWRRKPEALVTALGDALVEFESKYWTLTKAATDENFWKPGGSTEK